MSAHHRDDDVDPAVERDLSRRIGEAEAARRIEDIKATDDPFKDYDPERALATVQKIAASGGALKGLNVEAFLEEVMESREQDTPNHKF